jgi:hypothetical protein
MLAFLCLSAVYLYKQGYAGGIEALLVFLFAAFNWRTVILATSTLSEALYSALAVLAIWLAGSLGGSRLNFRGIALGIVLALACLTRIPGISLPIALFVYAFRRKRIDTVLVPILIAFMAVAGWFWWCGLQQTSGSPPYAVYYTSYLQDWKGMLSGMQGVAQASPLSPLISMLGKNVLALLSNIPVLCLGMDMDWYQGMTGSRLIPAILLGILLLWFIFAGFWRTRAYGSGLLHCYVLTYLALHIFWPYSIYDRFLVPLLPFILYFLIYEIIHLLRQILIVSTGHRHPARALPMALVCLPLTVAFSAALFQSICSLHSRLIESEEFDADIAGRDVQIADWLKSNTDPRDVLSCYRDPVYFLLTDRAAIRLPLPGPAGSTGSFLQSVHGNSVKYLICTDTDYSLESRPAACRLRLREMLDGHPDDFVPVFSTQDGKGTIYRAKKIR